MPSVNLTIEDQENYDILVQNLVGDLPSISILVNQMIKVASDDGTASSQLSDIISKDQSIFSKILKIANSFEYRQGRMSRVTDIHEAVMTIGIEKARQALLNASVLDAFQSNQIESKFKLDGLWLHSCGVALATQFLCESFGCKYINEAYACGLLHDLGKVLKIKFLHKKFLREIKFTSKNNCTFWFAEKALGNVRHDLLGSMIVNKWSISPVIEKVAQWHHTFSKTSRINVDDPNVHKIIDITILANHMIKELRLGNSGSGNMEELPAPFLRRLRLSEDEYQNSREAVRMKVDAEAENLAVLLNG